MSWTKENLWKLRKEIVFNSFYTDDFENSFGVDARACQNFFDGWGDYLNELMEDDGLKDCGNKYFDYFKDYDNAENLYDWYCCFEDEPLPISEEVEEDDDEIEIDESEKTIWDMADDLVSEVPIDEQKKLVYLMYSCECKENGIEPTEQGFREWLKVPERI